MSLQTQPPPFRTQYRARPGLFLAATAFIAPLTIHHLSDNVDTLQNDTAFPIASPAEDGFTRIGPAKHTLVAEDELVSETVESTLQDSSDLQTEHGPSEPPPSASSVDEKGAFTEPPRPTEEDSAAASSPTPESGDKDEPTQPTLDNPLPLELSEPPQLSVEPPSHTVTPATPAEPASSTADVPSNPPADSESAPDGFSIQKYKYVIIGAGTAAYNALAVIAHKDPDATVLLVGEEPDKPYMRPPLSKELWAGADDPKMSDYTFKNWMGRPESLFYKELKMKNLTVLRGTKAQSIKAKHKAIILEDESIVFFDKCLVAIGGKPNPPPFEIEGSNPHRVSTFRNLRDFQALYDISSRPVHITVVGGGFLGSELSAGLAARAKSTGASITQVFPESGCMGLALPDYLSNDATNNMIEEGVKVMPNRMVAKLDTSGDRVVVHLQDDSSFETDHVVVCTGLNTDEAFASESGFEIDEANGGIVVNAELQALSDIYVAGDASSFYDVGLKTRRRVEHYNHAVSSGRVAGGNMTGERNVFSHQSSFWSDLPGISYEAVGLIDSQLRTVGIFAKQSDDDQDEAKKYGKGIVYYLKDNRVVGVLTWNLGGKMSQARKVIAKGKKVHNSKALADWIGNTYVRTGCGDTSMESFKVATFVLRRKKKRGERGK